MASILRVITGPMFSKKSTRLIEALDDEAHADKIILLLKPATPNGDRTSGISFRKKKLQREKKSQFEEFAAYTINSAMEAEELFQKIKPHVVGIDEAHFLSYEFLDWITEKLVQHKDSELQLIVSGLDTDFSRRPFGIMPQLMALADEVTKLKGKCDVCKGKKGSGILTLKKGGSLRQIEVGDKEIYGVTCRACHTIPKLPGL